MIREDEDELDEREYPDPSDQDDSDETDTIPCPHCGESVYEQAEWCPKCGKYLSRDDSRAHAGLLIAAGVVVCLVIVLVVWSLAR